MLWFSKITIASVLLSLTGPVSVAETEEATDFVRHMNVGKAHLENRDSKKAIEALEKAVKLDPKSAPARRNLARAYLLARKYEQASASLVKAAKIELKSAATSYLAGLTRVRTSRFEEAVPYFERAVRLDPNTATLRFQLAGAYQAVGREDKAKKQLRETVRLDPLHASAHFKLAGLARKAGDRNEVQNRMREFLRLRKLFGDETRSAEALERCVYTFPESAPIAAAGDRARRAPPIDVWFSDVTDEAFTADADRAATAAAVIDVDKSGRCTFFAADPQAGFSLLKMSPAGIFERTPIDLKLPGNPMFSSCVPGNFHDDVPAGAKYDPKVHAMNDMLLVGSTGLRLLKRTGPKTFDDVTETAGLTGIAANRARWVDYEHDGDIDLLIARKTGLELWQNNGDGRFENVTAQVGIGETGSTTDVAAADLDADVAVDIVVARGTAKTVVFENQRAGRFAPMPEPPGPWPAAKRLLVNDLNNNGYPDTILISDKEAVVLSGHTATRQRLDFTGMQLAAATLIDYDNDGWLDLCAVGTKREADNEGIVRIYRNVGTDWIDVSKSTGLVSIETPPLLDVVAADVDVDGDTDLLLITSGGRLRLLRNDGGHVNGQLKIKLTTLKTNPGGIGTHIELRHGDFWVTRSVTEWPVEIGLAGHKRLDSIQTLWTNGVIDNQVDVALADDRPGSRPHTRTLTIVEKNVATGSCPFLYAWDGRGFRFVTDLLGNSPIGLPLRRDVMLPADPDEIVLIGDADLFPQRDGAYVVVVTDEFREVLYFDQAKLIAVDHPPGIEVHPTDKLMPPPFPRSEVWALESRAQLLRAVGDDGVDRTAALRAIDGVYAPPGLALPSPYRGMCYPLALTLDFGFPNTWPRVRDHATRPLVLALTGWLQYGDASTNIAMSQSSALTIIPPTLEVATASGDWRPVDLTVGMPAGKTKTILCDLTGKLPPGAHRLRLTTTFEIRWDRIALLERKSLPETHIHELLPRTADLQWRGFSDIKSRRPGHPTTPDFDVVYDRPAWRTALEGWCTRYGDVLDPVTQRDDRLVILNSGDALALRFAAGMLPPVPEGMVRTFFFYSVGWDKDGDHNVVDGATVGPLPTSRGTTADTRLTYVEPSTVGPTSVGPTPPSPPWEGGVGGVGPSGTSPPEDQTDWRLRYNTRFVPRDRFIPRD